MSVPSTPTGIVTPLAPDTALAQAQESTALPPVPKCSVCSESSGSLNALLAHCRKKHPSHRFSAADFPSCWGTTFLCTHCALPFSSRPTLSSHQTRVHPAPASFRPDRTAERDSQALATELNGIPAPHRRLPQDLSKAFLAACDRLATAALHDFTDSAVTDMLTLPKLGLAPHLRMTKAEKTNRLLLFPALSQGRVVRPRVIANRSLKDQVEGLASEGRLSTAARALSSNTQPVPIDDTTRAALEALHPQGSETPFRGLRSNEGTTVASIDEPAVKLAAMSMNRFSAPGVSGWTVSLVRLALRLPTFVSFLTRLTNLILEGIAPARDLLTSSRLIALPKPNGKIRPVAIGEIFYRIAAKSIVRHTFHADCLLPNQFGVGTTGGVEPAVHVLREAVSGRSDRPFSHVLLLDAVNAFNKIGRPGMAEASAKHLPAVYKAARWAYNKPSCLHLPPDQSGETQAPMSSSEGVRQGDPLGPLLFSLGMRDFLHDLVEVLGPDHLLVAYLDDVFILSPDGDTFAKVERFMASRSNPITLNPDKCSSHALADIRQSGLEILGTCVGPAGARERFLNLRIDEQLPSLSRLATVNNQVGLLLLRFCLQQNLRHLQRSLETNDISHVWDRWDLAILQQLKRMRGDTTPVMSSSPSARALATTEQKLTIALPSLPVRMGGLGLLNHRFVSPHAFQAASEASAVTTSRLSLNPDISLACKDVPTQRARCDPALVRLQNDILAFLSPMERQTLAENSSPLSYRWLSIIPSSPSAALSDDEVSAALVHRTLDGRFTGTTCQSCPALYGLGHNETCPAHKATYTDRHDKIQWQIIRMLRAIRGVACEAVPIMGASSQRNDIRVRASRPSGLRDADIDVTIHSLASAAFKTSRDRPTATTSKSPTDLATATAMVSKHCDTWRLAKIKKADGVPHYTDRHLFLPFVLTTGGFPEENTQLAMEHWKALAGPISYRAFEDEVSLILLRARARGTRLR